MASAYPEAADCALFSPSLSELKVTPRALKDAQDLNAFDAEYSRDLYLQGAMAVGQIARLLENLCSQDECKFEEEISEGVAFVPIEEDSECRLGFVSYQEPGSIEAWCLAVAFAHGHEEHILATEVDDDHDTCSRAPFLPKEVIQVQDDLHDHMDCIVSPSPAVKPQKTKFPGRKTADIEHDCDLTIRIAKLSARLERLGDHIEEFSKERSDALTRLDMELNEGIDDTTHDDTDSDDASKVDVCVPRTCSHEDLFVSRVRTATTISSDTTLVTPPEMEGAIPLQRNLLCKPARSCMKSFL